MNKAAVIILIDKEKESIILTLRSSHLRHHPGEVCFPGGRWQPEDNDLYATALRELEEELGIAGPRVNLIKQLPAHATLTGYFIQPWLAEITTLEPYQIDRHEVAEIILIPVKDVINPTNYKPYEFVKKGKRFISTQFDYEPYLIWGATARIMRILCDEKILSALIQNKSGQAD